MSIYVSPPGRPVHSNTNLASLGAFSHAAITNENYSLIFPPLSVARYSFIQLSELSNHGENEITRASKQYQSQKGDSNPGSLH